MTVFELTQKASSKFIQRINTSLGCFNLMLISNPFQYLFFDIIIGEGVAFAVSKMQIYF